MSQFEDNQQRLTAGLAAVAAWPSEDPDGTFGLLDTVSQAIGISILFVSPDEPGVPVRVDGHELARVAAFGHDLADEWLFTCLLAVANRLTMHLDQPPPPDPTDNVRHLLGDIAMMPALAATMRQLQSLVTADCTLRLALVEVDMPTPRSHEVVIRMQAAPINPSDLGMLLAGADLTTLNASGTADEPIITANVPAAMMKGLAGRIGHSLPVGNEGAGVVVGTGSSPEAQALLGKTVAVIGGATFAEYACWPVGQCLILPDGTDPVDGASCFVNPLTALGMVETMRMEGHHALVHTAAASNLGQMLNRICMADGVSLVNIVRKDEQAELLRSLGARFVCNSSTPTFMDDLTAALVETGATLAFDAIGGGRLASQILSCMETAAMSMGSGFSRYGSTTHKQVYIYGGLDRSPTELTRNFGMAWGMGGWLLFPFLAKLGNDGANRLRARVVAELTTTFASSYTSQLSLAETLSIDAIQMYARQATGEKALIRPTD